ncbi:MAG TPA: thiamine pyrophosphate-dependent dehydrogenase E1 component subunit alpha [Solirubrobacteraceae bacterium]|jgi:pyruvate dehydrogenase E1 component alpha subunit|nr:thiamine pyrophosphate-dependent dehydrogenase E1 component subunit alpha [Solirubrobacteraceae bacterium]
MSRQSASASTAVGVSTDQQLDWLRAMLEIRHFEDECHRLFAQGLVRGSTHLCQGQEAVVVGACRAIETADPMLCTYRGHGAVLAKGAPLDRSFGEIMGKADGLCGGKGGSMHLTDVSVGALGSFAIIGGHLPIALGAAFAAQYNETPEVTLCFFGDGSTNIGAFHEALNMASIWKLPVLFICENNLYGEYSPIASTTAIERIADRAASYSMPGLRIDGNDIGVVHTTVAEAAARARAGDGPTLIEAMTYRHKGHSRSDPATYRPEGELEAWLEGDPIVLLENKLADAGIERDRFEEIRERAERDVLDALERARGWPDPDPQSRLEHVWA